MSAYDDMPPITEGEIDFLRKFHQTDEPEDLTIRVLRHTWKSLVFQQVYSPGMHHLPVVTFEEWRAQIAARWEYEKRDRDLWRLFTEQPPPMQQQPKGPRP
jgi:hypothetical protein